MTTTKFLTARFIKTAKEEGQPMTIWAVASAPTLDRDREIIRADAWDLTEFRRHPVLILSHDYQKLWVARVDEITPKTDGLYFRATFADTAEANDAADLIRSTGMAAFSVGFIPIASESIPVSRLAPAEQKAALAAGLTLEGQVKVYTKVSLLEISIVSVPSQTRATLLNWKALAQTAELRAALEEITIEDGPDITIEEAPEDFRRIIQDKVSATLAEMRAHLISEEGKKEIRITDLKSADEVDVSREELDRLMKEAAREAVEVAIAKVRGRVI